MKWFHHKDKSFSPHSGQVLALREYVDNHLEAYRLEREREAKRKAEARKEAEAKREAERRARELEEERKREEKEQKEEEPPKPAASELSDANRRYSLSTPAYDRDTIHDLVRFLDEARKDTAMYGLPAMQKTYHKWEQKTAVRKTFSSEVVRRINENHVRPAEFYKAARLDKRVFHTMKSDYMYKPSRMTAIRCCLGLKLSYEEADELLKLAGYSLSPGFSPDLAIRFCLENGIYDIDSVNSLMESLGEDVLL